MLASVASASVAIARVRQSGPYSGLSFRVNVLEPFKSFPLRSELGSHQLYGPSASERKRNNPKLFKDVGLKFKALTVLYVPHSLDSG